MINTYLFNRISSIPFLRGFFPVYRAKSIIDPVRIEKGKKLIWRNNYASTLKITQSYMDRPVELGNLLFMRTRERDFLRSRIYKKAEAVSYSNFWTTGGDKRFLKKVEGELFEGFDHLKTLYPILKTTKNIDIPVSFASNVLYSLEKNGLRNVEMYEKILFPILKEKAQYLHAEGLAGAIWALGQYESKNSELISTLLEHYHDKTFGDDLVFVKNTKASTESYISAKGSHLFENDSTSEFKKLYFNDQIVWLELYEGLRNISSQSSLSSNASSKVAKILGNLEEKHSIISDSYTFYKQMIESASSS